MRLYHTGDREIPCPDLRRGRRNADFGQGFYLTPDRAFTCRWAGRNAVVNTYDFDETGLTIRRFDRDPDWFDYILRNRRASDSLTADAVIGPIANDTLFDTMGIIGSGLLPAEKAWKLLLIGPAYTQVAVKTEKALAQLRWLGAETITGLDETLRRQEEDAYQEAFAAAMEAL